MTIEHFASDASLDDVAASLHRNGVAVVDEVLPATEVDKIVAEFGPVLAETEVSRSEWTGGRSQVIMTALRHSETYRAVLETPAYGGVVDRILGPNCHTWRLSASALMAVGTGGVLQPLHRDEDLYERFIDRSPGEKRYIVTGLMPLTDFTIENGATRFVPGSNHWDDVSAVPDEAAAEQAVARRGSIIWWLGSTCHGLSVNSTEEVRLGLISLFAVGWLRQEENFYGSVGEDLARTWSPRIGQMLGWQQHGALAGHVPGRNPTSQLERL